jgi:hypothetical protein
MTPHDSLDEQLARLPRALPPARDLWPAIEAATRPRRSLRWPVRLAAGLLIAAVSAALTWNLVRQQPLAGPFAQPEARGALVAASFQPPQDQAYRAAHAALEKTFRERLSLLAPRTRARIEADLETIRKANADIRAALQQDPASPVLQRLLESTWQQEIDLYRSVARSTDTLSRRT